MPWALDLDGVLWRGSQPISGAAEAVVALRASGESVAFVTNNSARSVAEVVERLDAAGVGARADEVISSAMAAASLIEPGQRVLVVGEAGVIEALTDAGAELVEAQGSEPPTGLDAVVVGMDRMLTYERIAAAATAVRAGVRFVATGTDTTYPTASTLLPGTGAIVAAVAVSAGREPDVVAGKPHGTMASLVRRRLGDHGVVVGDRADTDGALAQAMGWRFALVLSGVTTAEDLPVVPEPELVGADLGEVVERLVPQSGR
jgi:4-nitrophenyl phosphatase